MQLISAALLALSLHSIVPALAADCVDLTGWYDARSSSAVIAAAADGPAMVLNFVQIACTSLHVELGRIDGDGQFRKTIDIADFVTDTDTRQCPAAHCASFTEKYVGIRRETAIYSSEHGSCTGGEIRWYLDATNDIKGVYPDSTCEDGFVGDVAERKARIR